MHFNAHIQNHCFYLQNLNNYSKTHHKRVSCSFVLWQKRIICPHCSSAHKSLNSSRKRASAGGSPSRRLLQSENFLARLSYPVAMTLRCVRMAKTLLMWPVISRKNRLCSSSCTTSQKHLRKARGGVLLMPPGAFGFHSVLLSGME